MRWPIPVVHIVIDIAIDMVIDIVIHTRRRA